ncbi:DNA-binding IclR family transcriptional regulator [Arthrobacter oryzae]|nr:DNA-binding IclR family transcriptional regulator [Arthrobacter oryzae]
MLGGKTLHDAGLLSAVRNGYYTLGPRIIEMDVLFARRIHRSGSCSAPGEQRRARGPGGEDRTLFLLLTAFRDSVLCIGEYRAPLSPADRFNRGQGRPFFQAAGPKVILAHLPISPSPHHRLKAIYPRHSTEIENAGLGAAHGASSASHTRDQERRYFLTRGEFNPCVYGVAAPILTDQKTALGSVGVAWHENERRDVDIRHAVRAVKQAATTDRLLENNPFMSQKVRRGGSALPSPRTTSR